MGHGKGNTYSDNLKMSEAENQEYCFRADLITDFGSVKGEKVYSAV